MTENKTYLLYLDILGFSNYVNNEYEHVRKLYQCMDSLNVHRHYAFKSIAFSDTLLVYNSIDPTNEHNHDYLVMYLCEFVQEFMYRIIEQNINFRAIMLKGDFYHDEESYSNFQAVFGSALIKAHKAERTTKCCGLFIHNDCQSHNKIFPSTKYGKDYNFVYLNQSLERLLKNTDGQLPVTNDLFNLTEEYWRIYWDIKLLEKTYKKMFDSNDESVRVKYMTTWAYHYKRYKGILHFLVCNNFDPRSICPNYNWDKDAELYINENW